MSDPQHRTAAEILAEHVSSLPHGADVDAERLLAEHPGQAEALRALLEHWRGLGDVVRALSAGPRLADRLRERYGDVDPGLSIDRPPSPARPDSSGSGTLERLEAHAPRETRYETRGEIARGGMGAILEVWDGDLRRSLAMKVALARGGEGSQTDDARLLARFLEEAQITAQLDHPGIVPVHELGLDSDGRVFFTMPLVRGRDLASILDLVKKGEEGWSLARAVGVLLKVCEAMAYAHSKEVIHRDLKPANVMVGRFGEVYVMDWGLAKVLGREDSRDLRVHEVPQVEKSLVSTDRDSLEGSPLMTMDGDVVGTPSYMSPEQARGQLEAMGPASDVYSIGAILYHLLAGHMPYVPTGSTRNALAVWGLLQEEPPAPLRKVAPGAPEELAAICEKAMSRDVDARYPDTVAMAEDLRAYMEGRVVSAHATGALPELRKWFGRNKPLAITAAAALVAVVAVLGFNAWRQAQMEDTLTGKQDELDALWERYETNRNTLTEQEARVAQLSADAERERNEALKLGAKVSEQSRELQGKQAEVDRLFAAARAESYVANLISAALNQEAGNYAEAARRLEACPEDLRGWEWHHLDLGENPALHEILGGSFVAGWDNDESFYVGTLRGFINVYGGDEAGMFASALMSGREITALATGASLRVCGSGDGGVVAWEGVPTNGRDWSSGDQAITAVAISADDARVYGAQGKRWSTQLGGVDVQESAQSYRIFAWDPEGTLLATLSGHDEPIRSLEVLPDGRLLSGADDGRVRVWDVDTGEVIHDRRIHMGSVNDIAHVRGTIVMTAGKDGVVVWDFEAGERVGALTGHVDAVQALDVGPEGRLVVTGSRDQTVRVWDFALRQELVVLRGHEGPVTSVAFSPDGTRIVTAGPEDGVRVWDTQTRTALTSLGENDHRVRELSLDWVGGGSPGDAWVVQLDPTGARRPQLIGDLAALDSTGSTVAHRGRRRRLRGEYKVDLWTVDGEHLGTLPGHSDTVSALAWGPRGRWLASGSDDRDVRLWDRETKSAGPAYEGLTAGVGVLAWHPGGDWLAVGTDDGRVFAIEVGAEAPPRELPGRHGGGVDALVWSISGDHLASGAADDAIHVWSFEALDHPPAQFLGHQGDVTALAFTPDATRLFSGSEDRTVRVWHRESGVSMLVLHGMDHPIAGLAIERDGRRLITWERSRYPVVKVWDTSIEDAQDMWAEQARAQRARQVVEELLNTFDGDAAAVLAALEEDPDLPADVLVIARRFLE